MSFTKNSKNKCVENKLCTESKQCCKQKECPKPTCMCSCTCECCCNVDMREIYEYLGKYVYNLLRGLKLPCNHPSLICSLQKLADGECLPCGHMSLEQLIVMAIVQEKEEKKCDCNHWVKYRS